MSRLAVYVYALILAVLLYVGLQGFAVAAGGPKLFVGDEVIHPSCASIERGIDWLDDVTMRGVMAAMNQGCANIRDPECAAINDTVIRARNLRQYLEGWHKYHCLDV
jgi:hypothetical protein